jgi:hypothetical protein
MARSSRLPPDRAIDVIDRIERDARDELDRMSGEEPDDGLSGDESRSVSELAREKIRLDLAARLSWIGLARWEIQAFAGSEN